MNQQANSQPASNEQSSQQPNGHSSGPRLSGQDIRRLRRSLSLTQSAFASQLGVRRITVTRWEAEQQTPLPEHLELLRRLHDLNSRALLPPRSKEDSE